MKEETEELSVSDVLSSIRSAVLETKSPVASGFSEKKENNIPQKTQRDMSVEDIFVLAKNMAVNNSSNISMSKKDFDKTSENLLRKYAKIFATWQAFD